ncbi:hypothetical protein KR018_007394 [Drosophila ironensis]|nr:hypothetical protein KR018_007394 [Drosophila ironensis]
MSDIAGTREAALAEKKICRFCLSEQKLASIFAENTRVKTTANLPLQIMAITAIEVSSGDGMPGYICLDCRLLFEHCYRFKQMCKRAETLLRQYPLTGTWPAPLDKPRAPMISGQASAAAAAKRDAPAPAPAPAPIVVEVQPKKLLNTMVKSNQVIIETVEILETSLLNKRKAPMASSTPMAERSQAYQLKVDTNQELSMDDVHSMLEDMANELDEMEPLQAEPTPQASPNKPKVLNKSSIRILNKGPAATLEPRIATPQITRDESGNVAVVTEILDPSHTAAPDDLVKNAEQVPTNVFPCPDCERSFPLQQLLDIHRVNHTRKRSFQCPECYKSFFSKYDLAKHNFIHTGEKPFKCSVCEKAFTRKALLHRHERSHTDIPKFICVYCERPFISREEMEKHAERHTKKRPFSCGVCGKAFAFKQGLERHEVVHQSNLPFPCQHCPRSFPTSCKLARHLVAHAGKRVYPCKYCPKSYLLSHHLSRHMRMHKQATADSSFVCSDCRETFTSYDSLLDHSTIHASMSLKCPLCREPIDDIDGVEVHIQLHRDSERFACEFCDHIFLSQAKAQKHIEDDHVVDMVPYQKEDEGEEEGEDAETEQLETAEREAQEFEVKEELLEEFLDDDDDLNDSDSSFVPPPKQRKTSPAKGRAVEVSAGEKRQTRSQDVKVAKPAAKKEAKVPAKQGRFVVKNGKWQKPTK